MKLPEEMLQSADRSTNEEAWSIAEFPKVLEMATRHKIACIGGQFQFRGPIGIAEMYWLGVDSDQERWDEDWDTYVVRANSEVRSRFDHILSETDFRKEAMGWEHIRTAMTEGVITDPTKHLVFVAYFKQNPERLNKAVDSTATRVTPPASSLRSGQESRHGQP